MLLHCSPLEQGSPVRHHPDGNKDGRIPTAADARMFKSAKEGSLPGQDCSGRETTRPSMSRSSLTASVTSIINEAISPDGSLNT